LGYGFWSADACKAPCTNDAEYSANVTATEHAVAVDRALASASEAADAEEDSKMNTVANAEKTDNATAVAAAEDAATTLSNTSAATAQVDATYAAENVPQGGAELIELSESAVDNITSALEAQEASAESQITSDTAVVSNDEEALKSDRALAATAVTDSSQAMVKATTAKGILKSAFAAEKDASEQARLMAAKAAVDKAKVTAIDTYVSQHQGANHTGTCPEEKKFEFNVCSARRQYKAQLEATKRAAQMLASQHQWQKKMAVDYADVAAADTALKAKMAAASEKEATVKADQKKLNTDGDKLDDINRVYHEIQYKEAYRAKQLKEEANEAGNDTTEFLEDVGQVPLVESEFIEEDQPLGRRLLQSAATADPFADPKADEAQQDCPTATQTAYSSCEGDVNKAYEECATAYKDGE
jgi:hypothetical protein